MKSFGPKQDNRSILRIRIPTPLWPGTYCGRHHIKGTVVEKVTFILNIYSSWSFYIGPGAGLQILDLWMGCRHFNITVLNLTVRFSWLRVLITEYRNEEEKL